MCTVNKASVNGVNVAGANYWIPNQSQQFKQRFDNSSSVFGDADVFSNCGVGTMAMRAMARWDDAVGHQTTETSIRD